MRCCHKKRSQKTLKFYQPAGTAAGAAGCSTTTVVVVVGWGLGWVVRGCAVASRGDVSTGAVEVVEVVFCVTAPLVVPTAAGAVVVVVVLVTFWGVVKVLVLVAVLVVGNTPCFWLASWLLVRRSPKGGRPAVEASQPNPIRINKPPTNLPSMFMVEFWQNGTTLLDLLYVAQSKCEQTFSLWAQ
jgi:hypothetical protein